MSNETASRRYAKAIFELANEEKALDRVIQEVRWLGETITSNRELEEVLTTPAVSPAGRKAVMNAILERMGVLPLVRNAVLFITERRRANRLPEIARALAELADEQAGRVRAEVASATALTEAQYARLVVALEKITGKKVALTRTVDPTLIGGVVTRVGDMIYDGSVKQRLAELRHALLPT